MYLATLGVFLAFAVWLEVKFRVHLYPTRPAQARYFPDVPFHQTFVAPVQTGIALRAQYLTENHEK